MIVGMGPVGPMRRLRPRPGGAGFHVDAEAASGVGAPPLPAAMAAASLLLLQESGEPEAGRGGVQDREARRHGQSMLDLLTRLQRALLGAPSGADELDGLAALVRAAPAPADPGLAAVQRAVLVRAAVELARARQRGLQDGAGVDARSSG